MQKFDEMYAMLPFDGSDVREHYKRYAQWLSKQPPDVMQARRAEAEMIFCMTSTVRTAVIEMLPAVEGKTYCLSDGADVPDPIGKGMAAYVDCARQIQRLIQLRFDELRLVLGQDLQDVSR